MAGKISTINEVGKGILEQVHEKGHLILYAGNPEEEKSVCTRYLILIYTPQNSITTFKKSVTYLFQHIMLTMLPY